MGVIRWLTGFLLILECPSQAFGFNSNIFQVWKVAEKSWNLAWVDLDNVHVTGKMSLESVKLK